MVEKQGTAIINEETSENIKTAISIGGFFMLENYLY